MLKKDSTKVSVDRVWSASDVREFCIEHCFYHGGSDFQYRTMLCYVSTHRPTYRSLYYVAYDIMVHSPDCSWDVETYMFYLEREVVRSYFVIS